MTQLFPDPRDRQPDSPDSSLVDQSGAIDLGQDALKQNNGLAQPSAAQGGDAEPCVETYLKAPTLTKATFEAEHDAPGAQSTLLTSEQSGPESTPPSHPLPLGQPSITDIVDDNASNIVIFGETGVGKSSVINLICGEKRAHISNDALGCTFQHEKHVVEIHGTPCALWDTTGLDEGSKGTVPAEVAGPYLKELIDKLAHSGGVHLVIYCIRATRLTTALKRNYDLFYVNVCRKKVPVALVVTGLEHQEGEMEMWWAQNEAFLKHCGMKFDAHACVTTLDVDDPAIQGRRSDSHKCLRDLVVQYARRRPWKIESSLMPLFSLILGGLPRGGFLINKRTVRRVIVYDRNASYETHTRHIGAQQLDYEWVHFDTTFARQNVDYGEPGVLVFYTSPLSSNDVSPEDYSLLKRFHDAAGGKTCPVIVVLRECHDNELVRGCEDAIHSRNEDMRVRCIADSPTKLDEMVDQLCVEHVEVKSRLWRVYTSAMQVVSMAWRGLVHLLQ